MVANQTICPIQHKWLTLHPNEASVLLEQLTLTIGNLRTTKKWSQAKSYLIWANQISKILFDIERHRLSYAPFQFTSLSISLADTCIKLGENELAINTLKQTEKTFETALENGVYRSSVFGHLNQCLKIIQSSLRLYIN